MTTILRSTIILLLTACLTCVVFLTVHHKVGDYGAETDLYAFYWPTANALEHGRIQMDDFHPPLYGWLLGGLTLSRIVPGEFEAALLLSMLSYIAVVFLILRIGRQSFKDHELVGWFAAVIVASNPTLMEFACRANVHIVYLAISLAAIYFALRKNILLTGIFVALTIWTRYTWMLSIIPLVFLPWKKSWPAWVIAALAWTGLGLLTLSVKDIWLYSLNHVSIAAGLYNTDLPTNPGLWDQRHQLEFEHLGLIQILLHNPKMAATSIITHIGQFGYKALIYLMVLPTGLLAIIGFRKKYWGNYRHPLLIWTLIFFAILIMTFWEGQYVLGLIPLLGLAAALVLADLPFPKIARWISPVVLAGLTVWGIITVNKAMTPGPVAVKYAATFMQTLPGKTVLSRDPRVFYYSGKQPGQMYLTPRGSVQVSTDYIFVSHYELIRNDTLNLILNNSDFDRKTQNLSPWPYVRILKMREEFMTPVTPVP
jgi:hypothetical protein